MSCRLGSGSSWPACSAGSRGGRRAGHAPPRPTRGSRPTRARKAAEDAAAAAARSAAAEERSATAHEKHAQLAQDHAAAEEQAPWRVTRPGKQDFRLVNLTATRKYDVVVTGEPTGRVAGAFRASGAATPNRFAVIDGRDTVELDLFVALQTQDRSVTVSWRPTADYTGQPWTQRCGLP